MLNEPSKEEIYNYLYKQNRPYSLLNIFENLHKAIKKPALEKVLTELVDEDKLALKEFGKSMVYILNQNNFDITAEMME